MYVRATINRDYFQGFCIENEFFKHLTMIKTNAEKVDNIVLPDIVMAQQTF